MRRAIAILLGTAFGAGHFVLLPMLAVYLNGHWHWPRWTSPVSQAAGVLLLGVAAAVFVRCAAAFRKLGRGTPQPMMPPERLVTSGLYRYSRNPIYVAYVLFQFGVFLALGHATLLVYAIVVALELHAWIVLREEPVLRRRFGAEYVEFVDRVPRWFAVRARPIALAGGTRPD